MAVGNTFGATALSSYGGFWIAFAIILTPGGFGIVTALGGHSAAGFLDSFGLFLMVSYQGACTVSQWLRCSRAGSFSPSFSSSAL